MKKLSNWGMGFAAAAVSLAMATVGAIAQQAPAGAAAPATTAPAAKTAPVVKKAPPPAATPAAAPAKKAVAKAPSACAKLDETTCKANTDCGWIVPKTATDKNGKALKPYCRKVAGVAVKKAAAPAAAATKAVPATAAPVTKAAPATTAPPPAAGAPVVKKTN